MKTPECAPLMAKKSADNRWQARCACGWSGHPAARLDFVYTDLRNHLFTVAPVPTQ